MKIAIQYVGFGLAALAAFSPSSLQARQNPEPPKQEKRIVFNLNGDVQQFKLEDFADGETKTQQIGGKTIAVTRHGDKLEVSVDGKPMAGPEAGGKKVMIIRKEVSSTGEGDGKEKVIVLGDSPEGALPDGNGNFMVFTHKDGDNAGTFIDERTMVIKSDPNGEPVTVNFSGQTKLYTLKGKTAQPTIDTATMADGETRTVAADGHVLAVTKTGDKFKLTVDGKELPTPHVIRIVKKEKADQR